MVGNVDVLAHFLHGSGHDGLGDVLHSGDQTGIQCGVGLAPCHRSGSCAQLGEGLFISRGVGDADDQTGHICCTVQGLLCGEDLTECQHVVVQNADFGLVQDHACNGGTGLASQLLGTVVVAAVYEGQAQAAGLVHVVCVELGSNHGQIQSAVGQCLQILGLGAQSCSGVNVHLHLALGLLSDQTSELLSSLVDGVACSHLVAHGQGDIGLDVIVLAGSGGAGSSRAGCSGGGAGSDAAASQSSGSCGHACSLQEITAVDVLFHLVVLQFS